MGTWEFGSFSFGIALSSKWYTGAEKHAFISRSIRNSNPGLLILCALVLCQVVLLQ